MPREQQMIEINLNAPQTPEELKMNIAGNARQGRGMKALPYIPNQAEITEVVEARQQQLTSWAPTLEDDGKPRLRFFSVGPNTYQIHCPLCLQRADTETVHMAGALGKISCLLSFLSCCFPIFSLSYLFYCIHNHLKSQRLFCNKCGGHLGFYRRPT